MNFLKTTHIENPNMLDYFKCPRYTGYCNLVMFKFPLKRHKFDISSSVLSIAKACKKRVHCNQNGMKVHHKDPFIMILLI